MPIHLNDNSEKVNATYNDESEFVKGHEKSLHFNFHVPETKQEIFSNEEEKKEADGDGVVNDNDKQASASCTSTKPSINQLSSPLSTPDVPLVPKFTSPALSLQSWIALALTLDGRDKLTKIFQYIARFLAWWLAGLSPNHARRCTELKISLTNSRKAFRLGRSLIEFQRLSKLGLWETLIWHLGENSKLTEHKKDEAKKSDMLSNENPELNKDCIHPELLSRNCSSCRSLSNAAHRALTVRLPIYCTFLKWLSQRKNKSGLPNTPLWTLIGSSLKLVGLCGFWAADNISFLALSGLFDNYADEAIQQRLSKRKGIIDKASAIANRSYFFGAIAGLMVNLQSFVIFRKDLFKARNEWLLASHDDTRKELLEELEKANKKQFDLFVALLKSCCDVLVFSNNVGVDLWQKRYGKKMNEGIHCICGLMSASSVLYSIFPSVTN